MTNDMMLHPGLLLIAGGIVLGFVRGPARAALSLLFPAAALFLVWQVGDGVFGRVPFLDYELEFVRGDRLSRLFGTIFTLMALVGGFFALKQESRLEVPAAFVYAGSAVGAVFAGDLITLFLFWELMAVGSTLVIWAAGASARAASMRYLMVHLFGGVVLMAGIAGHVADGGGLSFEAMQADSLAHWLILAGFLINAGAPPFSAWLPDAYPEASWSGTVFLSAFTTKTAVYVLLRGFPGTEILIPIGLYMVFYGIVYAILENDMRRILAYSIINQVGFMVTGIGIGTEMALNGAASHAFAHIIYKALLLMSAGVVLYRTGKRKCTELGGLFQSMPLTTICGTIGALAISAFPFTSGFVSKSMISQSAADQHMMYVWLMLAAASAGVFLHAGIKFPWFVFFQKDSGMRPKDPPPSMGWAMIIFSGFCIGLGVYPDPLYAILPYPVDYVPYTGAHVVSQLQLLLFSGLAFFLMLNLLKRTETITLDFDWLYRSPGTRIASAAAERLSAAMKGFGAGVVSGFGGLTVRIYRHLGPSGMLARTWLSGQMVLWVAILLLLYLVMFYAS